MTVNNCQSREWPSAQFARESSPIRVAILKQICHADLAHLVERHLAKVEVAGSSPVIRSKKDCRSESFCSLFLSKSQTWYIIECITRLWRDIHSYIISPLGWISSRASVYVSATWWYTRKKRDILSLLCVMICRNKLRMIYNGKPLILIHTDRAIICYLYCLT